MTHELFGAPISIYTRAQAIEDGVLVDITEQAATVRDDQAHVGFHD